MYSMLLLLFFFKQKTAYEMRISDWSSDVCSSDLTSTTAASQIIRVSNWSGNLADIENVASSTLTNTAIFNPPNLAPSYGAGATLWIAACWAQFAGRPITTYPDDTINQNAQNDGSADSRRSEEHTSELQSLMRIS